MKPVISLLVVAPDDESAQPALTRTLQSVERQGRGPWEVLVGTDAPAPDLSDQVRGVHVRVVTVEPSANPSEEDRHAHLLDAALSDAGGTWSAVLGAGDELEPGTLAACAELLTARPTTDVLTTDEQWSGPEGHVVTAKPRWSPHRLEAHPYLGRPCLLRTEALRAVGGFRPGTPGVEEWDAGLRTTERRSGEVPPDVRHLPFVGLSRAAAPDTGPVVRAAAVRVVQEHLDRVGTDATVEPAEPAPGVRVWRRLPEPPPLVTLVVPTAGTIRDVRGRARRLVTAALTSVRDRTTYPAWEVVVVTGPNTAPQVEPELRAVLGDRVRFTHVDGPFNFSRSVNAGASLARGELLLLLNDDTEVVEPRWLERMVSVLQDPQVGAVGAKLLHDDGTVQHVGIVVGDGLVPAHAYVFEPDGPDRAGAKTLDQDVVAVTGACLLTRTALYRRVGGLTEELPLNFNDVDLCLKIGAEGLGVVCTPAAVLLHHESSTRRPELRPEDQEFLERHWRLRLADDPAIAFRSER